MIEKLINIKKSYPDLVLLQQDEANIIYPKHYRNILSDKKRFEEIAKALLEKPSGKKTSTGCLKRFFIGSNLNIYMPMLYS